MYLQTNNSGTFTKLTSKLEGWWDALILKLPNIAIAILVMILSYFIARGISNLLRRILRKQMQDQSMRRIISKIVYGIILLFGFFLALGVLELDKALTSILAGAGVAALAIGLALQSTLSNTFSGIMLSFLPRIKIGDYVETSEHGGFVHEISLRNLVLRRPDNHYVIMPNSKFIEEPFVNYSLVKRGRIAVSCGVAYGSNLHKVKELVIKTITDNFPLESGERIEFYFTEFGDSSINFMTRFWIDYVKKSQMYAAQDKAILLINDLFAQEDINIPFPIRTLDIPQATINALNNKARD